MTEHAILLSELLQDVEYCEVFRSSTHVVFQIPTTLLYGMLTSYFVENATTGAIEHLSATYAEACATALALSQMYEDSGEVSAKRTVTVQ